MGCTGHQVDDVDYLPKVLFLGFFTYKIEILLVTIDNKKKGFWWQWIGRRKQSGKSKL
jgi:hypothetical protein